MRNIFVKTSNVQRFLDAVRDVEHRGAPEACLLLVAGHPGHGKSATGRWWAVQNDAARVRLKAAATPHWLLTDVVRELGEVPLHTCERMFGQAVQALSREPRPLVIDELENGLRADLAVVETIRDIADLTEVPVILIGREYVAGRLKRHRQVWTRISAIAEFAPATLDDVRLLASELVEVPVDDAVVEEVHARSDGYVREAIDALAKVERVGRRNKGRPVTLDALDGISLFKGWRRPGRAAANGNPPRFGGGQAVAGRAA